jgi:hypothetical protein
LLKSDSTILGACFRLARALPPCFYWPGRCFAATTKRFDALQHCVAYRQPGGDKDVVFATYPE